MSKIEQSLAPVASTIQVACGRLGISRTSLYNLISAGQIRAIKIGGRRLIPESELQGIVARGLLEPRA